MQCTSCDHEELKGLWTSVTLCDLKMLFVGLLKGPCMVLKHTCIFPSLHIYLCINKYINKCEVKKICMFASTPYKGPSEGLQRAFLNHTYQILNRFFGLSQT